jgi:hypothetical protein
MEGKMRFKYHIAALVCSLLASVSYAEKQPNAQLQALDDTLPGNLINDPSKLDWPIFGPGVKTKPVRDASIPGGGGAMQITSPSKATNIYDIGANAPIATAIKPGQKIVVAFYARTVKADSPDGKGTVGLRFQQNAAPYPGFGDTVLNIGPAWDLYEVKATSNIAIEKGLAVLNFQLSGAKQTIEIGQTIIVEGADSIKTVTKTAAPAAGGTASAAMVPNLTGKGKLINQPENLQNWQSYGVGMVSNAIAVKDMPGGAAAAVNVSSQGKNVYDAGINIPIAEALTEGDVLTIAFVARAISAETETGAGKIALRVQHNKPPYNGFGDNVLNIGPNWKAYQLRTQARMDVPAGEAVVALHVAGAAQSLEIGPVYVANAGPPVSQE